MERHVRAPTTEVFKYDLQGGGFRFLKTEMYRIGVDGQKRRFSNTMTSCLGSRLVLPHIRFENATCGRRVFQIPRKKSPFRYVWTVKYDSKALHVDEDIFKYGEKISVFESTRLRVERALV